jgi:hypothetical protein
MALVIREFIHSPESDIEANPIVIGYGPAPLGSASNPITIHVNEDCGHNETEQLGSGANTEIMAALKFWENLITALYDDIVIDYLAVDY